MFIAVRRIRNRPSGHYIDIVEGRQLVTDIQRHSSLGYCTLPGTKTLKPNEKKGTYSPTNAGVPTLGDRVMNGYSKGPVKNST